nr:MAG TPA: hypothetical protein [Caudoviricetes sp.]
MRAVKAETPSQNGFHPRIAVTLYSCVLSEHARPISADGLPSGFRVLVAEAPRTLKPSLMAYTPLRAVPDELSLLGLMLSLEGLGAKR